MLQTAIARLDPAKFEVFAHRLWAIGEEGRLAIQRVTASPIVSQGGECMCSFYNPQGEMVLACSGHLRFASATSQAIKKLIEWDSQTPGFHQGDQLFVNDPYMAGAHTFDMIIIKPIFHGGKLIAWTASSIHTADTGGVLRGLATEIFHEGIRIQGLRLVERGEFREDVFRCLTQQCRDPEYVGLDMKSMVAANNVCDRRYLELVERFGAEFVQAAGEKMIQDSEALSRAKLRSLPDGTWVSRVYGTALSRRESRMHPYQVVCTMTKQGDEISFDFTGTSPQTDDDANSTLAGAMSHMGVALTNHLFWDVPWSDGKMRPVKVHVPEGSILNCRFPAACGQAPGVGGLLVVALVECIGKMRYAGGAREDVNTPWHVNWYNGGPGFFYGGHNREGIVTAQGLYDIHGSGLGAAPTRDGVNTGGHQNIPSGGISDVERIEMQYPFIYFTRNHHRDGGGFGKHMGGMGTARVYMIYGSQDCSVNYRPYGGVPEGTGLFGGYSTGMGGVRALFRPKGTASLERMQKGRYPIWSDQVEAEGWGELALPTGAPGRIPLPEFTILTDFVPGGSGYGDPLARDPEQVARDVREEVLSARVAEQIYGVLLDSAGQQVDREATQARRREIRDARREGRPYGGATSAFPAERQRARWEPVLRCHESLELVQLGREQAIRCAVCGHLFCGAQDNYKRYALRRVQQFQELAGRPLPSGEPYLGVYHEYSCPGCATLLQVDVFCPQASGSDEPLWDMRFPAAT